MSKRKKHEDFIEELKIINPNIRVIENEKYTSALVKISVKCLIDGCEWKVKPNDLLNGHGCPQCKKSKLKEIKLKNNKTFLSEISQMHPTIIIESSYNSCNSKIKCRCLLDNHTWETTPTSLLTGHGCIQCHILNLVKTNEDFIKELLIINPNILALEEYKGSNINIQFFCKTDENKFYMRPNNILSGQGCPVCALKSRSDKRRKNHNDFVNEMKLINDNIIIKGEYKQNKTPILCECKIDNHQWYATPNNLLRGSGCLLCDESHGENKIRMYLINKNIDYIPQKI